MTAPTSLKKRPEQPAAPEPDGASGMTEKATDGPAAPEPSLHEKILTEFISRLRQHEHVGEELASAIASVVQGPKMPKRDVIAETVRKALDAKEGPDGSTP